MRVGSGMWVWWFVGMMRKQRVGKGDNPLSPTLIGPRLGLLRGGLPHLFASLGICGELLQRRSKIVNIAATHKTGCALIDDLTQRG